MTVTTEHFYTGNGSTTTYAYTFPYYTTSDIKVTLDDVAKTESTHYNVTGTNIVFTSGNIPGNNVRVHIYRETNVDTSKATFAAGSSIRATDLNNNETQLLYAAQERQGQKLKIVDADVEEAAEIQVSKLKDGAARQVLQTDSAGTGVEWTDNVDLPGTLDVSSSAAFDSNVTISGTTTAAAINASGAVGVDGNFDVNTNKFTVQASTGNTVVAGNLDVAGTFDVTGTSTYTGQQTVPGGALVKNIEVGLDADNEVSTTSGNLVLDSASGTVQVTDHFNVTGNADIDSNLNVDGTLTVTGTTNLAANSIGTAEIANDAIINTKIAQNAVETDNLSTACVITSKIADNAITSDQIATNAVTGSKIAANQIDSTHYVDGSIDTAHIADSNVTVDKLANNAVAEAKIATSAVTQTKIADNAVTIDKIADAVIVTNSEQAAHTVNDSSFFTTQAAEARYFNASTGETIKDGQSFPDNDTTIATTAAINDRIIDLVDDVGGFVPIANETSFPNANPDVNNGTGTIVSIGELASNHTSNGSGVISISNGTVGNSTVTINGAANSTTYSAGYGLLVETTTTLNTYTFHRLTTKATEVTTVAGSITNVNTVAGAISNVNAVAGNATNINAVAADATDIGAVAGKATEIGRLGTADAVSDMNTLGTTAIVSDMDTLADISSNVTTVAGISSNVTTVAGVSANVTTVAGISGNVTTVAGNNANVTTVASNMSTVNDFAARYRAATNNAGEYSSNNDAGDLYFNTEINALKVYNGSAWVTGVTDTGNYAVTTGNTFTGNSINNDNVKVIFGTGSDAEIYHNDTDFYIDNDKGSIKIRANVASDVGGDIHLMPHDDEYGIKIIHDGAVELYHNNVKKFETTSTGVAATGNVTTTGHFYGPDNSELRLGSADDLKLYHNGTENIIEGTAPLYIKGSPVVLYKGGTTEKFFEGVADGASKLYYDNSKKLETKSNGVDFFGHTFMTDSGSAHYGTDNDLFLGHNGTNGYIENTTGNLLIKDATGNIYLQSANIFFQDDTTNEDIAKFIADGACELYYDNAKKLETNSTGIEVSGHVRLGDNDHVKLGDGTNGDLRIYHNGTNSFLENNNGNLVIDNSLGTDMYINSGNDIYIRPQGTENGIKVIGDAAVELYYDGSKKVETRSDGLQVDGTVRLPSDSSKILLGAGLDLEIYHNGSDSYINNATGNLYIYTTTNNSITLGKSGEVSIKAVPDGAVNLYYDNSKKLETTSGGAKVTGHLYIDDDGEIRLGDSGDLQLFHNASTGESRIYNSNAAGLILVSDSIKLRNNANNETFLIATANGAVELYYDNSKTFETTSFGVDVHGTLRSDHILLNDDCKLKIGDSDDIQIWHGSSDSNIVNATGDFLIQCTGDDINIKAADDIRLKPQGDESGVLVHGNGNVELYYDNSKKFQTHADGVDIFGTATRLQSAGQCALYIGSTDASAATIFFDGDSNGDWSGSDYAWIRHDTGGDMIIAADNPSGDGGVYLFVAHGNESAIDCAANGAVQLYYDNSWKLQTKSTGLEVNGRLSINEGGQLVNESGLTVDSGGNSSCFRATGAAGHNPIMCWNSHTSGDRSQIQFADGGSYTSRGSITTNGSNVTYGGTSDYRLKQDDVLITDGITKVKALKPKRFKWKDNLSIGICDGFFAHEVQETAPTSGATIGTKDEVDSDGNPVYQSVDQAKLIPLLTAALQEAISKIETLETKVAALESS